MYVSNLGFHVTEEDLRKLFEPFGQVASAKLIIDRETGRSRGFGKPLSIASLDAAVRATDTFPHPVQEIIVLTTAQDEVNLQIYASILTEKRLASGKSRVTIQGWGTICKLIGRDDGVQRTFFSGWMRVPNASTPLTKSSNVSSTPSAPGTPSISSSMRATLA